MPLKCSIVERLALNSATGSSLSSRPTSDQRMGYKCLWGRTNDDEWHRDFGFIATGAIVKLALDMPLGVR